MTRAYRHGIWLLLVMLVVLVGAATAAWAAGTLGHSQPGLMNQIANWFTAAAHWHGNDGIPHRTLQHVWYMVVSMLIGAAIALPVGIGLGHRGRAGLLAINISNIGRAVPSFGLVILVFLLIGYGFMPVLVALVALAIPPMVTNSYVGMRAVDPDVREAATAMGMTGWEQLWQVELPIALPLVMAGIRTSAVQVMATATLAAYVGLGGLGRYLIDGLAQQDLVEVVGGAILVAFLAILTEAGLGSLQRHLVSRGLTG